MTAVPSLKRSATSRASLNRFGSDLWIADDAPTWRGAAIVRTTPSCSDGHLADRLGPHAAHGRRLDVGHLLDELLVVLDQTEVVQRLLPHAAPCWFLPVPGLVARGPNTAVPIRTMVAPSSTATS